MALQVYAEDKTVSAEKCSVEISGAHSKEEILEALSKIDYGTVATLDTYRIRSRTMHFANTEDFIFYFASMKGDPKIYQMTLNPSVSLLLNHNEDGLESTCEIEVQGRAEILDATVERKKALLMLSQKSPVVKNMLETGAGSALEVIRMVPEMIKYRVFGEILRGVGPTVLTFGEMHYTEKPTGLMGLAEVWYTELRAPFFTASLVPVFLGAAVAWSMQRVFDPTLFLLTVAGVLFLHAGTNIANDYFDHKNGNDEINKEYLSPFTGGSRMIQKGYLQPNSLLKASFLFFGAGALTGYYLYLATGGRLILGLMLVGLLSGVFYSSPPFNLGNYGVGELLAGLNLGILVTLGSYYVQAGTITSEVAAVSIPVGLLMAAVLYVNEFPDYNADKTVGKNHLVVRLGRRRAVYGFITIITAAYAALVTGVLTGLVTPFTLLGFLTVPHAVRAMKTLWKNYNNSMYLIPACANTIKTHVYTGLLITLGYIVKAAV